MKIRIGNLYIASSRYIFEHLEWLVKQRKTPNWHERNEIDLQALFQVYQSRFFGICFYRNRDSDLKAWKRLVA